MASGGGSRTMCSNRGTCSICLEPFRGRSPKLLPCFHTFCLSCLTQMADSAAQHPAKVSSLTAGTGDDSAADETVEVTITCPTCRKDVIVPAAGVTQFQSNFYLDQEEDEGHLQPLICDLCDQGQVASHMCTKCQMKLCFHCHSVHGECCLLSTGSVQAKAADTSSRDDQGKLLEKGKSQMSLVERMMTRISEDEKELYKQRKSLEDNLHVQYTAGLACLADARDELLSSVRQHAEAQEEQFKNEITSAQKKHITLARFISQGTANSMSSAEVQAALLSDSDVARFKGRVDQDRHQEFFRHKPGDSSAALLVKRLKEVVFGMLKTRSDSGDLGVSDVADAGGFDPRKQSDSGDPHPCFLSEAAHGLTMKQPQIDLSSDKKTKVDDLAEKVDVLMKKFVESESQGRKLLGENRRLLEEVQAIRDKNSVLGQEVASLQGGNVKLVVDVSKLQTGHQHLSEDYTLLTKQSAELSSSLAELQKQFHSLETDKSGVSTADSTAKIRKDVNAGREEIQSLKGDVSFSQGQIQLLQRQFQSLESSLLDKAHRGQITQLESEIAKLSSSVHFNAALDASVITRNTRTLIFKDVVTNVGSGYDAHTGVFTAPLAGTYLFLASVCPKSENQVAEVDIVVEYEDYGYAYSSSTNTSGTGHCVVALEGGQKVWLRTCSGFRSFEKSPANFFSGMLLMCKK